MKKILSIIALFTTFLLLSCAFQSVIFFDAAVYSDEVQDGLYLLTSESLANEYQRFFHGTRCSSAVHTEMPDFLNSWKLQIEANQLLFVSRGRPAINFERTGNYYFGIDEFGTKYFFSVNGLVINMMITGQHSDNPASTWQKHLQFALQSHT